MARKPLVSLDLIHLIQTLSNWIRWIFEGHPEGETGPSQEENVILRSWIVSGGEVLNGFYQ